MDNQTSLDHARLHLQKVNEFTNQLFNDFPANIRCCVGTDGEHTLRQLEILSKNITYHINGLQQVLKKENLI